MSLGYALLHRNRIEVALEAGPRKRTTDDFSDIAFGIMGSGDLSTPMEEFIQSRNDWLGNQFEQHRSRFIGTNGPFSFIHSIVHGDAPVKERFTLSAINIQLIF